MIGSCTLVCPFFVGYEETLNTHQSKLTIVVSSGPQSGQNFLVPVGESRTVGRTSASDITIIDDHFMSGRHFEIQNCGEFAKVQDFGSTNKTWVDNVAIMTAELHNGDSFRAGKTTFTLTWEKPDEILESRESIKPQNAPEEPIIQSPISSSFGSFVPHAQPLPNKVELAPPPQSIPRDHSPIESIDQTFERGDAKGFDESAPSFEETGHRVLQVPVPKKIKHDSFDSHFQDESDLFPLRGSESPSIATLTHLKGVEGRISTSSFWDIISKLSDRYPIKIVSHFKKIGRLTPKVLSVEPVFKEISNTCDYLPVLVDGKEWLRKNTSLVTQELAEADGIMIVISTDAFSALAELQDLSQRGVPGFSEPGGFLGWCWPSQWHLICESLQDDQIRALMGPTTLGVIYPSNRIILADVVAELQDEMRNVGFV